MSAPKRKDYLKNFEKQGKDYVYTGAHYTYAGTDAERKKAYTVLFAVLAVLTAAVLASGFFTGGGMKNSFYVILPYLGEACALFALMWYSFKLLTKGEKIRDYIYLGSVPKIPNAAAITAFFAVAGLLCSVIFTITNGAEEGLLQSLGYPAAKIAVAAIALLYRKLFEKQEWIIL